MLGSVRWPNLKETGTNSKVTFFFIAAGIANLLYFHWANLWTETISGPSVTECKLLKIRPVLHLICLSLGGDKTPLLYIIQKTFWFFKVKKKNQTKTWPEILHCAMECVTLCWSASEGLSPRLGKEASLLPSNTIHTILTLPATVLSPPVHLHSDTPSPPTTLFHGWICLALRPMHVCCFALKNTSDWVSLFSPPLRVAEAWRRSDEPLLENDHTCRRSQCWGW